MAKLGGGQSASRDGAAQESGAVPRLREKSIRARHSANGKISRSLVARNQFWENAHNRIEGIMALRVGCDIVCISRFRARIHEGGATMCERIFHPAEFAGKHARQLAGIFAAKEALTKALSLPPGRWLDIIIEHEASGAPNVVLLGSLSEPQELSISISHDGDYAMAFAVALIP